MDTNFLASLFRRVCAQTEKTLELPIQWDEKFLLTKCLGGGMSEVYLAEHLEEGSREVAVKILPVAIEEDVRRADLFRAEYETLKKAGQQGADCIVLPIHYSEFEGHVYFVMEYVNGQTIAELINASQLSILQAIQIAAETARSVGQAHKVDIVHGDIKPTNLIVQPDGSVKLVDFGLTPFFEAPDRSRFGGTLPYAAPEQLTGTEVDARTDIYCLGIVLRKLIEAATPPDQPGLENSHRAKLAMQLADEMSSYSKELRPSTADEIAARLESIIAQPTSRNRKLLRFSIAAVLALAVAFAAWFGWNLLKPHADSLASHKQATLEWVESVGGYYKVDELGHVYEINLNNCWVSNDDVERLKPFEHLLYAQFANSDVNYEGIAKLDQPIDTLVLAGTDTDDRIFPVLKKFRLVRLELSGTKVTERGLAQIPHPTQLEFIGLADNPITDSAAKTLAGMKRLEILNLRNTKITAKGLKAIRHLELKELDLGKSAITDSAITEVAKIKCLERLVINDCVNLTDNCIDQILALGQLGELDIRGCEFGKESVDRLRAMPNLKSLTTDAKK
jgi:serine/threonine protein kinase